LPGKLTGCLPCCLSTLSFCYFSDDGGAHDDTVGEAGQCGDLVGAADAKPNGQWQR
jgi:hypothetical protein